MKSIKSNILHIFDINFKNAQYITFNQFQMKKIETRKLSGKYQENKEYLLGEAGKEFATTLKIVK